MMFGSQAQPPPGAGKNQTMMFGAASAPPPPAPPPPAKNQTMMFGTAGSQAAPPPPAPPAPKSNQTMMFGTPASNAVQPPPPAAPPPSSKATMVFGAAPAAPAPAAKNQTMMFGTPASNAAASAPPAPTTSPKQTMVFGSAAPPPPSAKQTMVFGTAASNAAAANPPAAPPSSAKQTMVFGAPVGAPPAAKNTMMFGTPASNAVSEPAEETILETPGQSSRTVLFGTAASAPPAPAPPAAKTTMMFGRPSASAIPKVTAGVVELAGMSADEGQPNESTVRVDVAEVIEGHGEAPAQEPPRHDRTQRFAMSDAGLGVTPPEGQNPVQDRHNRTQLFAMSTAQERTAPMAEPVAENNSVFVGDTTLPPGAMPTVDRASRSGGTDLNSTLPPDAPLIALDPPGVSLLHDPDSMMTPSAEPVSNMDGPVATTLPNLPVLADHRTMAPLRLELPPEPMGSPQDLRALGSASSQQQQQEDAAALRAARGGGAGRAIVIILLIVAIVLAGVLVYRLFGKQLLGKVLGTAVPVEAIQATEQALATLRFDDHASQEKAISQLSAVLAQHPGLPETQGALVIAAAVRYDDVQGELTRLNGFLRTAKSNDDTARITELETKVKAVEARAAELKGNLDQAVAKLQSLMPSVEAGTSAHLAMLRADGLARGVLGDGEALTLAVAFRQRTAAHDDWAELIEPEYALNGGASVDEAIAQLVALKARGSNSTFLRPYVLLARLQLRKGESQQAREELEQVTTMNSKHEIARELLASIATP